MCMYVIMKTTCPSGYYHNGFVATYAPGHIMYSYTLLVPENQECSTGTTRNVT